MCKVNFLKKSEIFLFCANMPLLEAAVLGCPVACTDLPGHREQRGDYAFYFNPKSEEKIIEAIIKMIDTRKNGEKNSFSLVFNIENAYYKLIKPSLN